MQAINEPNFGHKEYFALEEQEHGRYEYIAEKVFTMTNRSATHDQVSINYFSGLIKNSLLIRQECPHIELFTRQDEKHWILTEHTSLDEFIELDKWQIQ